ncbi:MAG TPA: ribonuclease P protein component [Patescibacteria group bacterium]|nr:ribonuclease P protein component [Patescibacteria group bacterium]
MLAKINRLKRDSDFKLIRKLGKTIFLPSLRLRYLATKQPMSRFAFTVSTKISKKATKRNQLKRQLSEIIRLNLKKIKPGYQVVIMPTNLALKISFSQLKSELFRALERGRLLKDE